MNKYKQQVHDFWNDASCGENLYLSGLDREAFEAQAQKRYELEPFILEFAGFDSAKAKRVLEIGVGLGAEDQRYAQAGADLYGIDLTERAVEHTQLRLAMFGLSSQLAVGDAEKLDFPDEYFDQVYSWGVLHHSPDTPKAVAEVWRVLKHGGGSESHDLPRVEHGGFNVMDTLRSAGLASLAIFDADLFPTSGKSWHEGVFRCRSAATIFGFW